MSHHDLVDFRTLTAPRRKLAALPQKPAARPRRFLTPPRRLAPARHWARRVYRIFYALYGQWRASMCPTGALDCSVRGIPAMAAPNAYTLANERTARARWRSRSLPPGARSLARDTCPVTSTPNRSRSLALPLAASRRALVGAEHLPGISTKTTPPAPPGGGCAQNPARRCAVDSPWSLWGVGQGVFQSVRFFR